MQNGEAQTHLARHQIDFEQRASKLNLESVSQDRDIVCPEVQKFRDVCQRSESAAQLPRAEVQTLTHQFHVARDTSECRHNLNHRDLAKAIDSLLIEIEH